MLEEREIGYSYRDYKKEPLTAAELERLFDLLDREPQALLRRRDRAFKELGLTGKEPRAALIQAMAAHPTLLERPIGIVGERAIVGRPPERLLELLESR